MYTWTSTPAYMFEYEHKSAYVLTPILPPPTPHTADSREAEKEWVSEEWLLELFVYHICQVPFLPHHFMCALPKLCAWLRGQLGLVVVDHFPSRVHELLYSSLRTYRSLSRKHEGKEELGQKGVALARHYHSCVEDMCILPWIEVKAISN